MLTAGLNELALWGWGARFFAGGHGGFGLLGTMLEVVVFGALVWALVSSRANNRRSEEEQMAQRLRAPPEEKKRLK